MTVYELFVGPFTELAFMRKALVGSLVLSVSACPVGVFLTLRRMSLAGDAMSHAILPGVAAAFLFFGLSILPMTLGGLAAGLAVALFAGIVSRVTAQREDTSLAAFYLISLACGVALISVKGSSVDVMHILFGTVLALNNQSLILIAIVASITICTFAVLWRALVAECLDPLFLRSVSSVGPIAHYGFLVLLVLNLVAGFHALGTLLSVGLMILPAAAARFWTRRVETMCLVAVAIGMTAGYVGLLLSYHLSIASGPAIVLTAGAAYIASLVFSKQGLASRKQEHHRHKVA